MADEKPELTPADENKKDTVRINLPPGLAGKAATPSTGTAPTVKLRPTPLVSTTSEEESKKETAVMGMPVAIPQPKKDTSRVAVPAAKPVVPVVPRPTVKLKREEPPAVPLPLPAARPAAPAPAPAPVPVESAPSTSVVDLVLAIVALLVASAVPVYLWNILQIAK
jgi:hypothetical protein